MSENRYRYSRAERAVNVTMKVVLNAFFIAFCATSLFPLVWTFYSSLKSGVEFNTNVVGLPQQVTWRNYPAAFRTANIAVAGTNSLIVTVFSVAIILVFAFILGYFLNRYRFRGRNAIYFMILSGILIPVHSFIVPVYIWFRNLGLTNRLFSLVLTDSAFNLALATVLIENFIGGLPLQIDEAAIIDGASLTQRLTYIAFPMAKPIVSMLLIVEALWTWNEFPFALALINEAKYRTLPLTINNFKGEFTTEFTAQFAALILVSLPVLILYALFSDKIIQGMTAGAVKG